MAKVSDPQPFVGAPNLAEVAALVGDPGRANMLSALMDGRALTASELAYIARVKAPTASEHLAKLSVGGLLSIERRGRHRYYRLASPLVGRMLEAVMAVAADGPLRHRPSSRLDATMREARTCYDHLAGRVAVCITDFLIKKGHAIFADEGGEITDAGISFINNVVGVNLEKEASVRTGRRRPFCRPCLDWSERRPHLAGTIGSVLCSHYVDRGWVRPLRDTRALDITGKGREAFSKWFNVDFPDANNKTVSSRRHLA
jgi:DNA-binding transcriptional ArsR family regulator